MKNTNWNTYLTTCYTYDVAQDQRSAGGCHHHQIRKTQTGWQKRIKQTNGRYISYGQIDDIPNEEGETAFSNAKKY